ncbi:MAG: protein-glutamate methylesterase/protein-glutamine glutaminase [Methyloligellaceae bacterium]
MSKIGVVIVDDSALIRNMLTDILNSDAGINVLGAAADPYQARDMIKETNPDVITLDVEMPKMDGLTFLDKIMRLRPTPVIMISSLTQKGAETTLRALEMGALDYVAKPQIGLQAGIEQMSREIISKVKLAARANLQTAKRKPAAPKPGGHSISYQSTEKIVALGASTGGVEAISYILAELPADCPAIAIAQHMPKNFTSSFAQRLNDQVLPNVTEAKHKARLLPGHVYIAPGDVHLTVAKSGADYICLLEDGPLVSGHKPSVDHLFYSVAKSVGANAVGVILTGMGKDGADGLLRMRNAGAKTLGQDEASSTIYGMPGVAMEVGAVEKQVCLANMSGSILKACGEGSIRAVRV